MSTTTTPESAQSSKLLSEIEKNFMEAAFKSAYEALSKQEVPVGCIFVYDNTKILAFGRNTVNETKNATRHAEINCIEQIFDYCNDNQLDYKQVFQLSSVYVTVEPCIMCMSVLIDLNVKSIVYSCKNDRFGGQTVFDVASVKTPTVTTIKGGYRADEAMNLLKDFYKGVNPNAPPSKVKTKGKILKFIN